MPTAAPTPAATAPPPPATEPAVQPQNTGTDPEDEESNSVLTPAATPRLTPTPVPTSTPTPTATPTPTPTATPAPAPADEPGGLDLPAHAQTSSITRGQTKTGAASPDPPRRHRLQVAFEQTNKRFMKAIDSLTATPRQRTTLVVLLMLVAVTVAGIFIYLIRRRY